MMVWKRQRLSKMALLGTYVKFWSCKCTSLERLMVSYRSFENPNISQSYKYRWSSFATVALMIYSFHRIHGCHFHTPLYLAAKPITQHKYKMICDFETKQTWLCLLIWKNSPFRSRHATMKKNIMVPFPIDEWTLTQSKKVVVPKPTNGGTSREPSAPQLRFGSDPGVPRGLRTHLDELAWSWATAVDGWNPAGKQHQLGLGSWMAHHIWPNLKCFTNRDFLWN